ncbi:hypothetical protein [Mucilaginibacter panaciglaebae]|uniref:AbiTii domain-containing protein n=1 Tax=Mucilaginibacter panaciglaebae TaxID=502331 RepID=A0ABP7WZ69_9SPHI
MQSLNETQSQKLDLILKAFNDQEYLDSDEVLLIEPSERKANALINVLKERGFIIRMGDTEENLLPMSILLESSAELFLENGGFEGELKRANRHQGGIGTQINIHSTGHSNVINTGDNNQFTIHNNFERNLDALKESLLVNKVTNEDIEEISTIIVNEEPVNQGFGPKVKGWLTTMVNKSIEGTWEIGLATAGGVLTEILNKYYGL